MGNKMEPTTTLNIELKPDGFDMGNAVKLSTGERVPHVNRVEIDLDMNTDGKTTALITCVGVDFMGHEIPSVITHNIGGRKFLLVDPDVYSISKRNEALDA